MKASLRFAFGRLLIECGADVNANNADLHGGAQTAYALAATSAHPYNSGIAEVLKAVLIGDDNSSPS